MINPAPMRANGTKTHVPSSSSSSGFLNADRGDLLIRGFWEGSTDTIIDVRVTNLDSKSCKKRKSTLWQIFGVKSTLWQILR